MTNLLLVEDDIEQCELLGELLEVEGYTICSVHDGAAGCEEALKEMYDLILLDVTLPKLNGLEVLRKIRFKSRVPILMLSARSEDIDKIVGLEIGADDYLSKPYNGRELVARIKALLRRGYDCSNRLSAQGRLQILEIDDLQLNLANHGIRIGAKKLEVTSTEFLLLKTLIERAGELVTRSELTQIALNRELEQHDRAIDMHVSNLRRKIGIKEDGTPRLKTVRGSGYFYIVD